MPRPPVPTPEGAVTDGSFPIVGIGASAGGLEALEEFLRHVPEASGMALVVVQHLDPTHKGVMAELLQRATTMKVVQVRDRQRVKPDCVYVIPPNRDMSLLHGVLHLFEPTAPRGLRLPIDFFFRSLAVDRHERSIGVILSGMGADGTLGLRAIKEAAGLVLVQEPSTAKFDSMPRSAIAAGVADVVAPVADLPGKILSYVRHAPLHGRSEPLLPDGERSALEKIAILLRARTGHDFSLYKKSTVLRRIERRMGIHQIDRIATYVRYLQKNPQEVELLFRELLIGVTSFFRDPAAWDQLRDEALVPLLSNRPPRGVMRAWSVGCSTGEEAFSLAIVFHEALERAEPRSSTTLQVFATDLDPDAIARARQGLFPSGIASDVSPERLKRYFVHEEDGSFRIGKEIRDMVTFATQNAIMDPPFTRLDVLVCRNLLIYLGPDLQKRLLPLFHYSLNPGGILFLGSAETAGAQPGLFAPLAGKFRLYRRGASQVPLDTSPVPGRACVGRESPAAACGRVEAGPRHPDARGPGPAPAIRSGRRRRERGGRHPLRQRTDGKVPRARRREGELEHLRHGARRAPRGASRGVPQGCPRRRPLPPVRCPAGTGGDGGAGRRLHPGVVRARGAPRNRPHRLLRRRRRAARGASSVPRAPPARPRSRRSPRSSERRTRPARRCGTFGGRRR